MGNRLRLLALAFLALADCTSDTFGADGGPDAANDVGLTDVPTSGDGSSAETGPTQRFCESLDATPALCADFDIPNNAGAGFLAPVTYGVYSVEFQDATVSSPPIALQADVPGATNPEAGMGFADLVTTIAVDGGPSYTYLRLDIDVQLAAPQANPAIYLFTLGDPAAPPNGFEYGLAMSAGGYFLANRDNASEMMALNPQPSSGVWLHAHMDIKLGTTNGTVSLTLTSKNNGSLAGNATLPGTFQTQTSPLSPPLLTLGAQTSTAPPLAASYFFDNAVVWLQ